MKRIVVKIGSSGLTLVQGGVNQSQLQAFCDDITTLRKKNIEVIIVTSGAINCARNILSKHELETLTFMQAAAAIGMPKLMQEYQKKLAPQEIAQLLLTHEDFRYQKRYLNLRSTLLALLKKNIIPIINENDVISTAEITVGDNDQLAAMVAETVEADQLLLLTEADGLYTHHPSDPLAKQLKHIAPDDLLKNISTSKKTSAGRGGMSAKIQAIRRLTPLGIEVRVGTHLATHPLTRLLFEHEGTLFSSFQKKSTGPTNSKSSWMIATAKPGAVVLIDAGAATALNTHRSLLAVGVKKVLGVFLKGDVVTLKSQGKILGWGLIEMSSKELMKIQGLKSEAIQQKFPHLTSAVVIHADHLTLKES
jgi:glutamate 5-kinase